MLFVLFCLFCFVLFCLFCFVLFFFLFCFLFFVLCFYIFVIFDSSQYLGMNKVASFNGDFLTSLRSLRQFHISSSEVQALPDLAHLTAIKQISLSDNNLDEFFAKNPDYSFPPNLDTINLSQCRLTVAPSFTNALSSLTSVCSPLLLLLILLLFFLFSSLPL